MQEYDFDDFLRRMAELDYLQILMQADGECGRIERISYGVKGAVQRREAGSTRYAAKIKAFLFYMRYGVRPDGASAIDFQSYKRVVAALVEKGQFKPEALNAFR